MFGNNMVGLICWMSAHGIDLQICVVFRWKFLFALERKSGVNSTTLSIFVATNQTSLSWRKSCVHFHFILCGNPEVNLCSSWNIKLQWLLFTVKKKTKTACGSVSRYMQEYFIFSPFRMTAAFMNFRSLTVEAFPRWWYAQTASSDLLLFSFSGRHWFVKPNG